ncbi:MAG: sulfite exporter TauE/SafE family protein [Rhizobiales bacterium]|nr:sulfite exporter TauE/SafE family protein [Hyphomicrobiales bacterium]
MELGLSWEMAMFVAGGFAGGLTIGVAGFGAGPVLLAVWLHILPPAIAAPVLALCVSVGQVQSFLVVKKAFSWPRFWPFLAGGLLGVPAGAAVLLYVSGDLLSRMIGGFLVVYAVVFLMTRSTAHFKRGGRPADAAAGFGAGVACGAASIPGPPMNIWCSLRGWSKDVQRATFQPFNITVVLVGAIIYAWNGLVTANVIWLALIAVPAIAAGTRLGIMAYHLFDERQYRQLLLYTLLVSGVTLVWPF